MRVGPRPEPADGRDRADRLGTNRRRVGRKRLRAGPRPRTLPGPPAAAEVTRYRSRLANGLLRVQSGDSAPEVREAAVGKLPGDFCAGRHEDAAELPVVGEGAAPRALDEARAFLARPVRRGGADDVPGFVEVQGDRGLRRPDRRGDLHGVRLRLAPLQLVVAEDRLREPRELGEVPHSLRPRSLGAGPTGDRDEPEQACLETAVAVAKPVADADTDQRRGPEACAPGELDP